MWRKLCDLTDSELKTNFTKDFSNFTKDLYFQWFPGFSLGSGRWGGFGSWSGDFVKFSHSPPPLPGKKLFLSRASCFQGNKQDLQLFYKCVTQKISNENIKKLIPQNWFSPQKHLWMFKILNKEYSSNNVISTSSTICILFYHYHQPALRLAWYWF